MTIRPYELADASPLAKLFRRSVLELGPKDYSAAQVRAWAARTPSADHLNSKVTRAGTLCLVHVDQHGQPSAFIVLAPEGHIDLLYCAPEAAGTGVASALYKAMEASARKAGLTRLETEASEAARRFLAKHGFQCLHRRTFEIEGVEIHNYAMEKFL